MPSGPTDHNRIILGMDQTNDLAELNYLLSLVNYSDGSQSSGSNGFFNFSRATAFTLVQDYISKMYTLHQPATLALLCLYLPLFMLSLVGNSLVIYVVYKNPHMRRLKNLFLVNLAIADLSVTLICMPLTAGQNVFRLWVYGGVMCKLTGYIQGVAVNCSIFTLAALSIDRYLVIKNSSSTIRWSNRCPRCMPPWLLFLATWLLPAICVSPLLYVRRVFHVNFSAFDISLSYCIEEWPKHMDCKAYGMVLLFVTYIIPMKIIIGCYSLIGKKLCSDEFHRKTSDSSSTIMLGRKRVARMLIALIVVFIVCWLPYNVTSLSLDLNNKYRDARILPYTLLLGHAHSAVNPFLYWFLNKSFRHCMRRALRCSSRKPLRRDVPSPNGHVLSPWARALGLDFTKRDTSSTKKLQQKNHHAMEPVLSPELPLDCKYQVIQFNDNIRPRTPSPIGSSSSRENKNKKTVHFSSDCKSKNSNKIEKDTLSNTTLKSPRIQIEFIGSGHYDVPKADSMVLFHNSPRISRVSVKSV